MTLPHLRLALAALPVLALAAAACESETSTLSDQEIVAGIPWKAPEEARYRLMDDDEVRGSGVLRIEPQDGDLTFTQEFESGDFRDEVVVVAAAQTLRPRFVDRTIHGPDGTRRWQVEYADNTAVVLQRTEDDERRDEVTAPSRFYDSWTDVFVWRTIDFREGYEATYADVLAATLAKPQVISQTLKVAGKETVDVPAGAFQAWRLEIQASGSTQVAWYADTETMPLVRYDNGSQVFELLSLE